MCQYSDDQMQGRQEDERILQLLEDREYKKLNKEEVAMPEQEAFLLQTQYLTGGKEFELTESQRKGYDENDRRRKRKRKRNQQRNHDYDGGVLDNDHDADAAMMDWSRKDPHSLENINQTFVDAQDISVHPERGVKVERIFDVFPHESLLECDWEHVQFDNAPSMHTKKLSFMNAHKFHAERMKNAEMCTQNALIRCVDMKAWIQQQQQGNGDEGVAMDRGGHGGQKGPDWISLYGTNGVGKVSEYEDEKVLKYEWAAEYVPVHIKKDTLHFMVVPKMDNEEDEDVFYANFNNRMNLRHRPTDTGMENVNPAGGKKGLSEEDKRCFKKQPMNIKLSVPVPRTMDSD